MKMWAVLLVIGLLVPEFAIQAQDEPLDLTSWPVIERCVGPATASPEDWSYPGVILLEGYAGLHGVNQQWATPRVLSFDFETGFGSSLSPDGRWYAVPQSEWYRHSPSPAYSVYVNEIRVYSTIDPADNITLPWGLYWVDFLLHDEDNLTLRWVDNEQLVFRGTDPVETRSHGELLLVNPFSGEIVGWSGVREVATHPDHFFPAPDWSRAVVDEWADGVWVLVDPVTGALIADLPDLARLSTAVWSPDSMAFIASKDTVRLDSDDNHAQLYLFDADGTLRATVFDAQVDPYSLDEVAWSNSGQYVSFLVWQESDAWSGSPRLYLADIENERVIDTCLTVIPRAWSPDRWQLAVMPPGDRDRPIYVFDLEQWALYTIAYHSGTIIGWREESTLDF